MKVLKWLVLAFVGLILALVLYLTLLFNPNDFKPEIIEQVKTQTGRTLEIKDDLSWTFFPTLGIQLGGISFSNPQGMKPEQMMSVDGIVAEVALMPLLSKEVEIEALKLDGLTVNLVTDKSGKTSFDGLGQSEGDPKSTEPTDAGTTSGGEGLAALSVGGVEISNATVNIINQQTDTTQQFSLDSFTLGQFSLGKAAELAFKASAKMPDLNLQTSGKGSLMVSKDFGALSLKGLSVETQVEGKAIPNGELDANLNSDIEVDLKGQQAKVTLASVKVGNIEGEGSLSAAYGRKVPSVDLVLSLGDINLNDWIPASEGDAKGDDSSADKPAAAAVEPDLSALKSVDMTADIKVKSINMDKLKTTDWKLAVALKNGVLDVKNLAGKMYDGELNVTASLDGRKPVASYRFEQTLSGVQIRPLLTDAAEVDFLSGDANFSVTGSGYSLIPDNLKKNLQARGNFAINDGSLYGVNIPQMIRSAEAKLKGDLSAGDNEEQKTDFTSLTGNFTMAKGVVNNPDLDMQSPLIRLTGKGDANILSQTIDYQLSTKLVASLEGQGGGDALKGVDIPLAITGTFAEPKFALDTEALLNNKVKDEIKKQEDKLKNKLLEKLGGF
ncbi:AsmA family protein [Shewanella corallii]|uniref:AsmA family protein n=1 Tax=Shewanella corallii TaxID=560080 RepID=A0ABT0N8Y0_9GAMM|nr:AsmA family protein [Shewanella corallii]MCL2914879.1 AsmA family protein [Shewanella corallii]